jgi:AcrR family transcriptional regulator
MNSKAAAARRVGRPRVDNPQLRELLLDTAVASFTANGVAGTSVRSIAADAGVSAPLVSYYFGTKDDMVAAVYAERFGTVMASLRPRLQGVVGGVDVFLEAFAKAMGDIIAEHPWYPQLWIKEVVCDSGAFHDMHVARVRELNLGLVQRFKDAQLAGQMNQELDPEQVMTTMLALVLLPAASQRFNGAIYGAKSKDDYEKHILAVIRHGLFVTP